MNILSALERLSEDLSGSTNRKSESSYFKQNLLAESSLIQYEKQMNFLRQLKKNSPDSSDREMSFISNTMAAKIATLLEDPSLETEIQQLLPEPNREHLLSKILDLVLAKDISVGEKYEHALRVCTGILTEGVVTAPIDGLVSATIDPTENFPRLTFAGPIRAVGGTNLIYLVILAEHLRRRLNLNAYVPTKQEIDRTVVEVKQYQKKHPPQVKPATEELEHMVRNCTVMIDGVETEAEEVPLHKYLPRIQAPRIRGIPSLVYTEGFLIRGKKVLDLLKYYDLPQWTVWINDLIKMGKNYRKEGQRFLGSEFKYALTMGRPVLSNSGSLAGLRLKIGTTPTIGLAGSNVTKQLIDLIKFINVGSQLIISLPGKATTITGVTKELARPLVVYQNGLIDYYTVNTYDRVREILDLGQILVSAGDFIQSNKLMPRRDYCDSCWGYDTNSELKFEDLTQQQHLNVHRKYPNAKLHPYFSLMLDALEFKDYFDLRVKLRNGDYSVNEKTLKVLKALQLPCSYDEFVFRPKYDAVLRHYFLVDLDVKLDDYLDSVEQATNKNSVGSNLTVYVNKILEQNGRIRVGEKGYATISARVGRCEAVNISKVRPRPYNALINYRPRVKTNNFWAAVEKNPSAYSSFNIRYCRRCKLETHQKICKGCRNETSYCFMCFSCDDYYDSSLSSMKRHEGHKIRKYVSVRINYEDEIEKLKILKLETGPLKTVAKKYPIKPVSKKPGVLSYEPLIKGYFRSENGLFVTKDGTIRTTFCNAALTHFTPRMVHTSIDKLKLLGYHVDVCGAPLVNVDQVLTLKFNDAIVSYETANWFYKTAKFIDKLILHYYKGPLYYNFKDLQDMTGVLAMMISPHTSTAVLGRVIGYTNNFCVYTHPLSVTCRRRDADGDMDATFLAADMALNCSKKFISEQKRGAFMSVPLTLTTEYAVNRVGKEILALEIYDNYYDGLLPNYREHSPVELKKLHRYESFLDRVVTEKDMKYNVKDFELDISSTKNWYKDSADNTEKLHRFIEITEKLVYLNKTDIYVGLIEGHLLPDITGNLNAFYRQDYKCSFCQQKYAKIPLALTCIKCRVGLLKPTVYPGMVMKYYPIIQFFEKHAELPTYLAQKIKSFELILSVFRKDSGPSIVKAAAKIQV